jgi:phytoene dehydrogenase-like protein
LARRHFRTEKARALFAGLAAHSFLPLDAWGSAAFGLVLGAAAHAVGWPIPRGGAQRISDVLAAYLRELGGRVETSRRVSNLEELPPSDVTLLDLTAWQAARIANGRLPENYRRRLERFPHGPGVFKVDFALSEPIPWRHEACRRAGTVHVGGTFAEICESEARVAEGRLSARPFVLVAQQSAFDDTRAPDGKHTAWAYCHVPRGWKGDGVSAIEARIERFAPGFRDCILARCASDATRLEAGNANLVDGDITGGACTLRGLVARPTLGFSPYQTPVPGLFLCSSSTPPGAGVHGMCGYHAAKAAMRRQPS